MQFSHEVRIAQTHYGQMLVYANDQVIGKSLLQAGEFQEKKVKEVVDFLAAHHEFKPKVFVDIGANIGTHLIYSLKSGLFDRAFGIEPDEANFRLLSANVLINNLGDRTKLIQTALSNDSSCLELELCPINYGDHRIRVGGVAALRVASQYGESDRATANVTSHTFDAIFAREDIEWSNMLVWIDTQGHEGHVFEGAKTTLYSHSPAVVCEFWPYGLERSGGKEAFFNFLSRCSHVYDVNASNWSNDRMLTCAGLKDTYMRMLAETTPASSSHTDLLCLGRQ
jgi:FkbM family methyltransferase